MRYQINKAKAVTFNTEPSMTDQAGAAETDINIIVPRYIVSGQAPGPAQAPMEGVDFTELPNDLRGFIEFARSLDTRRNELPEQLRDMDIDELLALTGEQILTKLTPAPTPVPEQEQPKA